MKVFPPFRIDTANQCLWRRADTGQEARILLTPKAFAVLAYLVEHAGCLVSPDELLEAVWTGRGIEPQAGRKTILGGGAALGMLHEAWRRALSGERQIVLITGEPGIGKTALAEEFQRRVAVGERSVRIVHGQCIEGDGSREASGPLLDTLGPLCRGPQ